MERLISKIVPFIVLGTMIVIFVFGIVLLSYLLIFGALVGLIIFAVTWLREKIFPSKQMTKTEKKPGRTYDHNDL